jgi:hypothetical protein
VIQKNAKTGMDLNPEQIFEAATELSFEERRKFATWREGRQSVTTETE